MTDRIDPATEARAIKLFTESMSLPLAERQRWLSEQAGDDQALTDQLRRLTEAEAYSTGFLEEAPEFALRPDRVGTQIGAYTIIDEHAIGGMSTVYRAERSDGTFEQQVAIKVFDAVHLRGDMVARFAAERRILAALEHPGIARIIDGGALDDHTPYVVMEWIEGEPITHYCDRHTLDLAARLMLFCRVCEALELAHRLGVVHRDVKPGNVLVNASGQPKLIDFGIAKQLDADSGDAELPETRQGLQLMTPEYASPEQIRGQAVGQGSDVYSLGVLLYELLTGTRPHQLAGLSPVEIEQVVCESIAIEPSAMARQARNQPPEGLGDAATLGRRLKGDLDRIVMTAMRHESEQRYDSVAAFADDIQRYLANKPVRARGASKLYRASKFIARHRAGFSATVIAFVALIGALVLVQLQAEKARNQAERAESATQFLTEMISRADPYEETAEATLAGALRASIPDIEPRSAGQPKLEADLRYAVGYALANLGEIEDARGQLERALVLRLGFDDELELAMSYESLGLLEWWAGDFEAAALEYQRALELVEGVEDERAKKLKFNILTSWSGLASVAGDYQRSAELGRQALAFQNQSNLTLSPADLSVAWGNLGSSLVSSGDFEDAKNALDRAMSIRQEAGLAQTPDTALILNTLSDLYMEMEQPGESLRVQTEAVEVLTESLGAGHRGLFNSLVNLSGANLFNDRPEEALRYARSALEIAETSMEENHPQRAMALQFVARLLEETGQVEEALDYALRARQTYANNELTTQKQMDTIDFQIERMRQAISENNGGGN